MSASEREGLLSGGAYSVNTGPKDRVYDARGALTTCGMPRNLFNVLVMATGYLLVFCAFQTTQMLASKLLGGAPPPPPRPPPPPPSQTPRAGNMARAMARPLTPYAWRLRRSRQLQPHARVCLLHCGSSAHWHWAPAHTYMPCSCRESPGRGRPVRYFCAALITRRRP